jgi:hypothetical protein
MGTGSIFYNTGGGDTLYVRRHRREDISNHPIGIIRSGNDIHSNTTHRSAPSKSNGQVLWQDWGKAPLVSNSLRMFGGDRRG